MTHDDEFGEVQKARGKRLYTMPATLERLKTFASEGREIAKRPTPEQMRAFAKSLPEGIELLRDVTNIVGKSWFLGRPIDRLDTVNLMYQVVSMASGMQEDLEDSLTLLDGDAKEQYRDDADRFWSAAADFWRTVGQRFEFEIVQAQFLRSSEASMSEILEGHEQGKRDIESGLGKVYTEEEFRRRFK